MVSQYPNLVDEVRIKEGIDGAVLKGANLMWDGVADQPSQLGGFKKDDVRAIVTFDGKYRDHHHTFA